MFSGKATSTAAAVGDVDSWISLHIFIHDFARLNAFARAALHTLPTVATAQSFFIRYWYGGPHFRLRFRGPAARAPIETHLRDHLTANAFISTLSPALFYPPYRSYMEAEIGSGATSAWFENGSIHAIPYIPEMTRYGGPQGLPLVENYFVQDSAVILAMLAAEPDSRVEKILFGFSVSHAVVASELGEDIEAGRPPTGVFSNLSQSQSVVGSIRDKARSPALRAAYKHARTGGYFPQYLLPLEARLRDLVAQLRARSVPAIPRILGDLLHMSFNRAGISPARETVIRWLAAECATSQTDDTRAIHI